MLLSMATVSINAGNEKNGNVCPPEARVLELGEFHGEEVEAQTGEKWLGLHISDNESMLLNYQLTIETVNDPIVDEDHQKTGKKVGVDLPLEPIFLVDAESILSAGPVQTVFKGDYDKTLKREFPVTLKLVDASYELKVIGEDSEKCGSDGLPQSARLVLTSGESTQVLYSLEKCGNDAGWFLLWAGDLDRDGKLDLYLSVNQHYNVNERKLFLSSQAGKGRMVAEVAEFVTSGC